MTSVHVDTMKRDGTERSADIDLRMPICHGVDIEGLSIPQLQQCLESRKFSVYDLTECYLERIRRINGVLK